MADPNDAGEWMLVPDAAENLDIKEATLRVRISRNTVRHRKGNDGRVRVFIPNNITASITPPIPPPEAAQDAIRHPAPEIPLEAISALRDAYEARIDDLKGAYEARVDELRAITMELADRHDLEVDRMAKLHREEIARMIDHHRAQTAGMQGQLDHANAVEGEVRAVLLDLLKALGEQK